MINDRIHLYQVLTTLFSISFAAICSSLLVLGCWLVIINFLVGRNKTERIPSQFYAASLLPGKIILLLALQYFVYIKK